MKLLKEILEILHILQYRSSPPATYSASVRQLATAATATDIFEIAGAGRKLIKILHLQFSGVATAAGAFSFGLLLRDSPNSAGTSTAPTAIPHDPRDPPAAASLKAYTANPTVGNSVGTMQLIRATVTTAAGAITQPNYEFRVAEYKGKPVTLVGDGGTLAINLASTTITGGAIDIDITWTEEDY